MAERDRPEPPRPTASVPGAHHDNAPGKTTRAEATDDATERAGGEEPASSDKSNSDKGSDKGGLYSKPSPLAAFADKKAATSSAPGVDNASADGVDNTAKEAANGTNDAAKGANDAAKGANDAATTSPSTTSAPSSSSTPFEAKADKKEGQEKKEVGEGGPAAGPGQKDGKDAKDAKDAKDPPEPAAEEFKPKPGGIKIATAKAAGGTTSRKTVGLGERVTFTDSKYEGGWTATAALDGSTIGSNGHDFTWQAPAKAGSVTITHEREPKGGGPKRPETIVMNVVAPSGVVFRKRGAIPVPSAGAGMRLNVVIQPTTVSFGAVSWKEKPGPAVIGEGYFKDYARQAKTDLAHNPYASWLPMGDDNRAIDDVARTEDKPKLNKDGKDQWYAGRFSWDVPNLYKVGDGPETEFAHVTQAFDMKDGGAVTVTKGGVSHTQGGDGKVDGDIEQFATPQEADAKLKALPDNAVRISHALAWLDNARARGDQKSIDNMLTALAAWKFKWYLSVQCTNTFKWFDADPVSVTVGSFSQNTTINTNRQREFEIELSQAFSFKGAGMGTPVTVNVVADGKPFQTSLRWPFKSSGLVLDSEGRYKITSFLRD